MLLAFLEKAVDVLIEDLKPLYFGLDHVLEVAFEVWSVCCQALWHVFSFRSSSGVYHCL